MAHPVADLTTLQGLREAMVWVARDQINERREREAARLSEMQAALASFHEDAEPAASDGGSNEPRVRVARVTATEAPGLIGHSF